MDTITKFSQATGALILGNLVGGGTQYISSGIQRARAHAVAAEEAVTPTLFDLVLDALVNVTFIMIGTTFVERGMVSVSQDLSSLSFYIMGILGSNTALQNDIKNIFSKMGFGGVGVVAPPPPVSVAAGPQ